MKKYLALKILILITKIMISKFSKDNLEVAAMKVNSEIFFAKQNLNINK